MEQESKSIPKKLKRKNPKTKVEEFKFESDTLWQDKDGNVVFS